MSILLYDLAGADRSVRFSPFCWIAKFALLHKGLDFETLAVGFLPKSDYPDPDYGRVPVIKVGDELVKDSDGIINWLEVNHPQPALSRDAARTEQIKAIAMGELMGAIFPLTIMAIHAALTPEDQDYFRTSREKTFGMSLETIASKPGAKDKVEAALARLSDELGSDPWFGGDQPDLSDYYPAAILMWRHSVTRDEDWSVPPSISKWFERIKNHFDGYSASAPCAGA